MKILITGGLGYIGSHISSKLKSRAIILDNLSNSSLDYKKKLPDATVYIDDISIKSLKKIFLQHKIKGVIHLAGFKSVDESALFPLEYYRNNVVSTLDLLNCMDQFQINNLIFSSSATVYGSDNKNPLKESYIVNSTNPYGSTKIVIENILSEYTKSKKNFKAISLRYFNPIGADIKKQLSDQPLGRPQNLMPMIIRSVIENKMLTIYGNDYCTTDGTCIRDYIHVKDLADAHILALKKIKKIKNHVIINIGLGKGVSVYELIRIFENSNNLKVKYKIGPRRLGDVPISFADNKFAKNFLNWKPKFDHKQMCMDSWQSAFYKINNN